MATSDVTPEQARALLNLDSLKKITDVGRRTFPSQHGMRALNSFLLEEHAAIAARIIAALRTISPNATTVADLAERLDVPAEIIHRGLDLLSAAGAVDTMPRG